MHGPKVCSFSQTFNLCERHEPVHKAGSLTNSKTYNVGENSWTSIACVCVQNILAYLFIETNVTDSESFFLSLLIIASSEILNRTS